MDKSSVVISREWDNPGIKIRVTSKDIQIEMSLNAFVDALADEMGNPATLLTRKQLLAGVRGAAETVITKMKAETTQVM